MGTFDLLNYVGYTVDGVMQIKDGLGFRVKLKYSDGRMVVQQKSGYKGKKEAKLAREQTIAALDKGEYILYPRLTVKEVIPYWFEHEIMANTDSNNTYMTYRNIVYNYIIPAFGDRRVCKICGKDIDAFITMEAQQSEAIAALIKTVMNTFLDFCKKKKIVARNPMKGLDIRVYANKEKHYGERVIDTSKVLNEEQLVTLVEKAKDTPIYLMILFAVLLGLRISEVIGLKYSDVDFNERTLTIKRQLGKKAGTKKEDFAPKMLTKQERKPKTASGVRKREIPDLLFEEILREKKRYEKNRSRRKREFQDLGYIICSTYGRPRSRQYHTEYYKNLLKASSLPNVTWHALRHSNCTLLIKHDGSPKAVAKGMGHKNERISLDRYTDKQTLILDEVDAIERFISQVIPTTSKENNNSDYEIDISEYI